MSFSSWGDTHVHAGLQDIGVRTWSWVETFATAHGKELR